MLPNQQFYHCAAAYHAAEVLDNLDLSLLIEQISYNIGDDWSLFDYELACSYAWADDFGAPESLLTFTQLQRQPDWTQLQTLAAIPTFPDNQKACGNWLCSTIRLHS